MTSVRSLSLVVAGMLSALFAAGCGATPPTSDVAAIRATSGTVLPGRDLERQLASGFREALARVAVMQQPTDGAADLGQDLPEGLVGSVRCDAATAAGNPRGARTTTCRVAWRTAAGTPKRTSYAVRLTPGRCFLAEATPQLPDLHDATIQTYSEHPLNRLVSLVPGC